MTMKTLPNSPFVYPGKPHRRRHRPPSLPDHSDYKPYLRDEFVFRCVYCLMREKWLLMHRNLGVEHWWAKSTHPELRTKYSNLLYVCNYCNNQRGTKRLKESWRPERNPWGKHLRIEEDGTVNGISRTGVAMMKVFFFLNDEELLLPRKEYMDKYRRLCSLLQFPDAGVQADACELYKQAFGFPANIPDLSTAEGARNPYCSRVRPDWY